jgi:hypothetical protein
MAEKTGEVSEPRTLSRMGQVPYIRFTIRENAPDRSGIGPPVAPARDVLRAQRSRVEPPFSFLMRGICSRRPSSPTLRVLSN